MCDGELTDEEECDAGCCTEVDGDLGEWSDWECDEPCGKTFQRRTRNCTRREDSPNEEWCPVICEGETDEEIECDADCCPRKFDLNIFYFQEFVVSKMTLNQL